MARAGFFDVFQNETGKERRAAGPGAQKRRGERMQYDPRERVICAQQVCWLPLDRISPRQNMPFGREDSASLSELAESIRRDGLIVPITVQRQAGGRYQVVSGNRRLMACRLAGLTHIDAVVLSGMAEEANVRQLLDGVRSGRLHYLEEADALSALRQDYALSAEDVARSLGLHGGGGGGEGAPGRPGRGNPRLSAGDASAGALRADAAAPARPGGSGSPLRTRRRPSI